MMKLTKKLLHQAKPSSDDKIWEELLKTQASHLYLAAQVKKAEELLDKKFAQKS